MEKSTEQVNVSCSGNQIVKMQCLVDKQRHRKITNRGAKEPGINSTLNCKRDPDKGLRRSGYTRRSRNGFKQFSIYESGKLFPLEIELQSDHLAVVPRSINHLSNIFNKSTVGIIAKHPQNIAWKANNFGRRSPGKSVYQQVLGIGNDRAQDQQGLHAGAPGPPSGQYSNSIGETIAFTNTRMIEHYKMCASPPTEGRIPTSANQEDSIQSEGCSRIVLDVMRYASVTSEADIGNEEQEQETHQVHTSSLPRPLDNHSVPQERAAQLNQVAHEDLLNAMTPTQKLVASKAPKSVKRDESDEDSDKKGATRCVSVNSKEKEARGGQRQRWATRLCASLCKTFCGCVREMRFFLQFGVGLRTPDVSYSVLRPIKFFCWWSTASRVVMGLLARAVLVDDDCLPLTFQLKLTNEAPTRAEAADSTRSARNFLPEFIYLSEDPFVCVGEAETKAEAQTEAEAQEDTQGANAAAMLVAGFGNLSPEAFEGQDVVATDTAGVANATESHNPQVNVGVSYSSAPAPEYLEVTSAGDAVEVGAFGPNQYVEQTNFHQVGMATNGSGNAGIEFFNPSSQDAQDNYLHSYTQLQGTNYIIPEAHTTELDNQTEDHSDAGLHLQTVGMQNQLIMHLIWNLMKGNLGGGETFEGTEAEVDVIAECAIRVNDMSRSPPSEPP